MHELPSQEVINLGAAFYTLKTLPIYDWLVTRFSNRFVWHCPRRVLLQLFKQNISKNHLDIGVGAGYFLDKANLSPGQQRLGLADLSQPCLDYASKKLAHLKPEIYHQDLYTAIKNVNKGVHPSFSAPTCLVDHIRT